MKNFKIITAIFVTALALSTASATNSPALSHMVATGLSAMPLSFTENQGQWDDHVLFRADANGAIMWFTRDGAYYQFTRRISEAETIEGAPSRPSGAVGSYASVETMMIKAAFIGANPNPSVVGENKLGYKCNYFLGNHPAKWRTDVPSFQAAIYNDIYPGIDLKYYGNSERMEYDFIVQPGTDFSQIRIQYEGVKSLSVDADGQLVVTTEWGTVTEHRPIMYQSVQNERVPLEGGYTILSHNAFGFKVKDNYNPELPLVIDPVLSYSTYLGGASDECGTGIAVDENSNAYVCGFTESADFPTFSGIRTTLQGERDAFVAKVNSTGTGLIFSTYLGGSGTDWAHDLEIDADGNIYLTGATSSADFPTENPLQASNAGGNDAFVAKLNSAGNVLMYSTYLGGDDTDYGRAIAVDGNGNAHVTGWTRSADFQIVNAIQPELRGSDAFVAKLNGAGDALIYSTYLGGSDIEDGQDIAVDDIGNAYITGFTVSLDFPTLLPFQANYAGEYDVFIAKLNSSGSNLIYSTYLGGSMGEIAGGIAVDDDGDAYVTGYTYSTDFPTENPLQAGNAGGSDAFVAKLNSAGTALVYSTYLGGTAIDLANAIAVDDDGNAYVTGATRSVDFRTVDCYDRNPGMYDAFVAKLDNTGGRTIYSTYLGGSDSEWGWGIAADESGYAYVVGETSSLDFPTQGPLQPGNGGLEDAFILKIFGCCASRGNVNGEGGVNVSDLTYLVDYLFRSGAQPPCLEEGNVDGSGSINVADLTFLVNYLFKSGTAPSECQ